jgi:hypothetical protein
MEAHYFSMVIYNLKYVGVDGIPNNSNAGNVLRTHTTLKISMRYF